MYLISGEQFGIQPEGIDLLRSGYPYRSISKDSIDAVRIYKGKNYQRWRFMLVLGLMILAVVLYYSYLLFLYIIDPLTRTIHIEFIAAIAMPFFLGLFLVIASLQKATNLQIDHDGKKTVCSLRKIEKERQLPELITSLQQLVPSHRVHIEVALERKIS